MSKISPFDFLNSINLTKDYLIVDSDTEKQYNAFMVNKGLSYFPDTILYANEMNINYGVDRKLQYDYLINSIRPRKRISKWWKRQEDNDLNAVMEYYGYNMSKAETALTILSTEQLEIIKKRLEKGGQKK